MINHQLRKILNNKNRNKTGNEPLEHSTTLLRNQTKERRDCALLYKYDLESKSGKALSLFVLPADVPADYRSQSHWWQLKFGLL